MFQSESLSKELEIRGLYDQKESELEGWEHIAREGDHQVSKEG